MALGLFRKGVCLAILSLLAQSCASGNVVTVDTAVKTASVPQVPSVFADEEAASDGKAILSALSADASDGLQWENPENGARGTITALGDEVEDGRNCLAFTTTRENFDGVGLYQGKACEDSAGVLRMREFRLL